MSFEELQIEELNHIISDLKQQLNYELRKNRMLNKQLDALVELGDKISHQNEELDQTIEELQNDLKQATNEIKLLNNQIDKLIEENNALKFRNKMLIKTCLNSVYGMYGWKYHFDYADTDSIKETTENDDNN